MVLLVAWLGWVFDSMDATIYTLVLRPALNDLLSAQAGGPVSQETILWHGGVIFSISSSAGPWVESCLAWWPTASAALGR